MNILSFYNEEWEQDYLKERLSEHEVTFLEGTVQDHPDLKDENVEILSVFVKSHIGADELDKFPNLKYIVTRSTGFDHIDVEEAKTRGVTVSNVPFYGANTVAEQAFALLLSLSRRICESYERVVESGNFSPEGLRGFDLKDKTIGIIGTGNIGAHAARMAKGFGMNILGYDVRENEDIKAEVGLEYRTLDELLEQSDVITLHAPYNEHTHHMLNMNNMKKIKKGAYIINTARGGLIETAALVKYLEDGTLGGAGLDVLEEEEYMLDHIALLTEPHPNPEALKIILANQYLIDHPQVLISPHNAFNTEGAIKRILDTTVSNIEAAGGGSPENVING